MRYGTISGIDTPATRARGGISRLILGSLVFSTEHVPLVEALLDRFIAAGGNAVDTAYVYGRGASERARSIQAS